MKKGWKKDVEFNKKLQRTKEEMDDNLDSTVEAIEDITAYMPSGNEEKLRDILKKYLRTYLMIDIKSLDEDEND